MSGDAKLKVLAAWPCARPGSGPPRRPRPVWPGHVEGNRRLPTGRKRASPRLDHRDLRGLASRSRELALAGVPFLLRTGKRLSRRVTEVAVQFKLPPLRLFRTVECQGDFCDLTDARPAVLAFRIQPDEGISLSFSVKRPGMQLDLHPVRFEFDYGKSSSSRCRKPTNGCFWTPCAATPPCSCTPTS